jgi:hypothetical protein
MLRLKVLIGVCAAVAATSAVGLVATASAAPSGTTAFTCKSISPSPGAGFSDAHCKTAVASGATFVHKAFTTPTVLTVTNTETGTTKSPTKLHGVSSGVELELESNEVSGVGTVENVLTGEAHKARGFGKIEYKGVTVVKPAGKGCKVKTGEVKTAELEAETFEMGLKFKPKTGEEFASFEVEGCSVAALNKKYTVTGSIIGTPEGATTKFTRAGTTEQGTLFLGGQKAGIDGTLTFSARLSTETTCTPLALTTPPFTTG